MAWEPTIYRGKPFKFAFWMRAAGVLVPLDGVTATLSGCPGEIAMEVTPMTGDDEGKFLVRLPGTAEDPDKGTEDIEAHAVHLCVEVEFTDGEEDVALEQYISVREC